MAILSFKADDNGDLSLHNGANLAMVSGKEAVAQDVGQATKKLLGENPFNTSEGVDYFGTVFSPNPDYDQFRFQLVQAAMSVPDVVEVYSLEITKTGDQLYYKMEVNSKYGQITVSNSIVR